MALGTHGPMVRVRNAVSHDHSSSYVLCSTDYLLLVVKETSYISPHQRQKKTSSVEFTEAHYPSKTHLVLRPEGDPGK